MADKNSKSAGNSDSEPGIHRDPGELRLPLMVLLIGTAILRYMLVVPVWVSMLAILLPMIAFSLVKERKLIFALLNYRCYWTAVAPLVAMGLYFSFDMALQLVTSMSMKDGVVSMDGSLPVILGMLLSLRGQLEGLPPLLMGTAGAVLVSFGEGVFWRGFLQTRLMLHLGHLLSVLVTAGLYTVFYFFLLGPMVALMALVSGLVFSYLTLQSRSLVPSMVCHAVLLILGLWLRPDFSMLIQ